MSVATMEIGNVTEAEIASTLVRGRGNVPDGWRIVGSGSYRTAFLSPSGVVYKVGNQDCNRNEHDTAERCRAMEAYRNVKIPMTALYECENDVAILAMEFVKGVLYAESDECECGSKYCDACCTFYHDIEAYFGIDDMHAYNLIVGEDGNVYVIDLGEY